MTVNNHLSSPRISVDSDDEGLERFFNEGWTDGLPVVLPTPERVHAMVAGSGLGAGELIGQIPPGGGDATIEKIAVNAVMAGCLPKYMPVIVAAIRALLEPRFNLHAVQTTTNPTTPLVLVNGPASRDLGINSDYNCMGPGTRANATIGRAVRLTLVNVGGAVPGLGDKSTHGMPGKYTFCFAENEPASPWEPLHVERGFRPDESIVTVFSPQGTTNVNSGKRDVEELIETYAYSTVQVGSNNFMHGQGDAVAVLCPQHATMIADAGYSKADFRKRLHELARVPMSMVPASTRERRGQGRGDADFMHLFPNPDQFAVVVAGGPGGIHSAFLPTFADCLSVSKPVVGPK
jgi:hypothetical protein